MPNRLARETSPYLLQHQNNPVDWYSWSPEALERARVEDKPIFLSIGYSACHWCHVMEHESFENDRIARLLNEHFVAIKVDREERPDLDQVYMAAVQVMTGRGGWPMSVFLTPGGEPFFGGTYWPPERRMGMPGFDEVLRAIADAWQHRRPAALEQANQLTEQLRKMADPTSLSGPVTGDLGVELLLGAVAGLERVFDYQFGGFGGAPKFPHPMDLQVLMRFYRRQQRGGVLEMVGLTLDRMAAGGMYDHLGGGFHRYSVDREWQVPHFEKMLYDNALLARTYIEAYRLTGRRAYAHVARATLDYLLREMQDPAGGFYSTQDADSEGVEGKYFVWTPAEIHAALGGSLAETFCRVYDVSDAGNFEGQNILNLAKTLDQNAAILGRSAEQLNRELHDARTKLLAFRRGRVPPATDDKVLVAWNGLAIDALAEAAGALDEPRYLEAATRAADFIWQQLRSENGRLLHTWRRGAARGEAYLDDYAALLNSFVTLYEAGFQERFVERAVLLAEALLTHFLDRAGGGFFYTADDHEQLISRHKDLTDNATPSGSALAAMGLLRLSRLTGRQDFVEAAVGTLEAASNLMRDSPQAVGQMLVALDFHLGPSYELVVLGDCQRPPGLELVTALRTRNLPPHVLACRAEPLPPHRCVALDPLFTGKPTGGDGPALFVCENFACREPALGLEACLGVLERLAPATVADGNATLADGKEPGSSGE